MHIRKLSLICGMALCAGVVFAQSSDPNQAQDQNAPAAQTAPQTQPKAPNPARQARRLGRQLGLSPDQVSQIEPILADRQQQLLNVRSDATLTPQQRRAQVRSIMQGSKSKIEAVLTDPQKQQYEQMLAARRERRQQAASPQPQA